MSEKQIVSDTYSVSFGAERIEDVRRIASIARLQQSEIMRQLWDRYGMITVGELLEESEQDLTDHLDTVRSMVKKMTDAKPEAPAKKAKATKKKAKATKKKAAKEPEVVEEEPIEIVDEDGEVEEEIVETEVVDADEEEEYEEADWEDDPESDRPEGEF